MTDPGQAAGPEVRSGEQVGAVVPVVRRSAPSLPASVEVPLDVALGAAVVLARPVVGVAVSVGRSFEPVARSLWQLAMHPPLVPEPLSPGGVAERLADRGRRVRYAAGEDATEASGRTLDVVVPTVLDPVLDRIDLTSLVISRVDLGRLVGAVLDEMDLTEVVLSRVDLDPIVTRALDGMDLTDVVLSRVDLDSIVTRALDGMDLTDVVRSRVDLAGIAEEVIDEVDLPEIIRDSTTGVAGAVVDGTRLRAVQGDEVVNRLVDRILLRRKARRTAAPAGSLDEDPTFVGARPGEAERAEERAEEEARRTPDGAGVPESEGAELPTGLAAEQAELAEQAEEVPRG